MFLGERYQLKKVFSSIMIFLMILSIFSTFVPLVKAESTTWIVDDDGPADFSKIQAAIDMANPGDTIYVKAGRYHEHINIYKSLMLIGEDRSATIIDGDNSPPETVIVNGPNIMVSGFTITNGWKGVYLHDTAERAIISHNIIRMNELEGIWIENAHNYDITDNLIYSNGYSGIYVHGSDGTDNRIIRNFIRENSQFGIYLHYDSDSTKIADNMIESNYLDGIRSFSSNNIFVRNTLSSNGYCGIALYDGYENSVYHNNFVDNKGRRQAVAANPAIWDNSYPSGGNYWSDYTGVDNYSGPNQDEPGSDGIGDSPYVINANNQDRYPLMNLWTAGALEEYFAIGASPESQTILQGESTTYAVEITSALGYAAEFILSLEGLPTDASYSFDPSSVFVYRGAIGSSTLTITTSSATPMGTYTLTIKAITISGEISTSVTLIVSSAPPPITPDFEISVSPLSKVASPRGVSSFTITITSLNGFNSPVMLTAVPDSVELRVSFTYPTVTPPSNGFVQFEMKISAVSTALATHSITVTGTAGGIIHSMTVSLTVPFLSVPYFSQGDTQWCLPTSVVMTMRYYGIIVHPWDVASAIFQGHNSPAFAPTTIPDLIVYLTGAGLQYDLRTWVTKESLKAMLDGGNPVILSIPTWKLGHAVVLTGYSSADGTETFFVNDPSGALIDSVFGRGTYGMPYVQIPVSWDSLSSYATSFGAWAIGIKGTPSVPKGTLSLVGGGDYDYAGYKTIAVRHTGSRYLDDVYIWESGFVWNPLSGDTFGLTWRSSPDHPKSLDTEDSLFVLGNAFNRLVVNPTDSSQNYLFEVTFSKGGVQKWSSGRLPLTVPAVSMANPPLPSSIKIKEILNEYGLYTIRFWLSSSDGTFYDRIQLPEIRYAPLLMVSLGSPANLFVTDPEDRHIGFDPITGQTVNEIPEAVYSGPGSEPQVIAIPEPLSAIYDVKLLGTASGIFELNITLFMNTGTLSQVYEGSILEGQILVTNVNVSTTQLSSTPPARVPPSALADKLSMSNYVKLELQWLTTTMRSMSIKDDVKQGLLDKLMNATTKIDQAIDWINSDNETQANNMLNAAQNILGAFINQVKAQTGKAIATSESTSLITDAQNITQDIKTAKTKPI